MPIAVTPVGPKKLLNSKWTAVQPLNREKHFLVTRLIEPDPPEGPLEQVEIEAVMSKRRTLLPWRELRDSSRWSRGWE
ncbi:MAG: TIGR02450 family Trp-rich protein [Pseudomonadota bacterium]